MEATWKLKVLKHTEFACFEKKKTFTHEKLVILRVSFRSAAARCDNSWKTVPKIICHIEFERHFEFLRKKYFHKS
jgi:hypothetical protein